MQAIVPAGLIRLAGAVPVRRSDGGPSSPLIFASSEILRRPAAERAYVDLVILPSVSRAHAAPGGRFQPCSSSTRREAGESGPRRIAADLFNRRSDQARDSGTTTPKGATRPGSIALEDVGRDDRLQLRKVAHQLLRVSTARISSTKGLAWPLPIRGISAL